MTSVRFTSAAARDVVSALRFHEDHGRDLAARFLDALENAIARVQLFPDSGAPSTAGTRTAALRGFPYSLVYRARPDGMPAGDTVVFALAHHARRPQWWTSRVQEPAVRWVGGERAGAPGDAILA